jgi:hypothetical protein
MKNSVRGISALALIAAALVAGCGKSPSESLCAKGNECGLLDKGKTEAQCVADADKTLTALHDDPGCKEVADKYDAFVDCSASLSCAELKDAEAVKVKCKQQIADLVAALLVDAGTCKSTVPVPGASGASGGM